MSKSASGKAIDDSTDMDKNVVHTGDCFDVLADLPDNAIHAVVSDPPYGLAFMGRDWDDFEPKEYQEWCEQWATEVKRVLKPGGHLLAFSGNRTHHRLFTGVEDTGFEIRDTLTWHYGSGFPKASDISKTIDKRADAEREVVGKSRWSDCGEAFSSDGSHDGYKRDAHERDGYKERHVTAPATDAAKKWDGWKTGLKPATEFVVMARKPYDGATVDSVLEHGTGALNIEACRVNTNDDLSAASSGGFASGLHQNQNKSNPRENTKSGFETPDREGRYPANVVFDETAAERLDQQVGKLETGDFHQNQANETQDKYGEYSGEYKNPTHYPADSGGPSRYFYTSKASKAERTLDGKIDNAHPTVKPIDLMEWLVKLVTAEDQIVLDPFCGSGTTCMAAKNLNRQFIGIEQQPKWADVARVRVGLTPDDPSVARGDDSQSGLEAYE